jgi:hypothetical protein
MRGVLFRHSLYYSIWKKQKNEKSVEKASVVQSVYLGRRKPHVPLSPKDPTDRFSIPLKALVSEKEAGERSGFKLLAN